MNGDGIERERRRQQALLEALWPREPAGAWDDWLRAPGAALTQRGLQAYRANAGAVAERALASAFPTVQALIGDEAFAALARACWRACPPTRGDMAWFGAALPGFIEQEPLEDAPYLADSARLDWALSRAESAADVPPEPQSLALLAEADPSSLRFIAAPGLVLLRSPYPVVSIWRAHCEGDLALARVALEAGQGEAALVWRRGWKAGAQAVDAATAQWTEALLAGHSIGTALDAMPADFGFEPWLLKALEQQWIAGVRQQV